MNLCSDCVGREPGRIKTCFVGDCGAVITVKDCRRFDFIANFGGPAASKWSEDIALYKIGSWAWKKDFNKIKIYYSGYIIQVHVIIQIIHFEMINNVLTLVALVFFKTKLTFDKEKCFEWKILLTK